MRIKFVNGHNGNEEFGGTFFSKLGKLALVDIRVAQANGGAEDVAKVLENNPNFKGKVVESKGYTELNEKVSYVTFTMPVTHIVDTMDDKTGDLIERKQVTEDYSYYLEVRSYIEVKE